MKKLFLLFTISLFTSNFIIGQKVWHNITGSIAGDRFNVISTCGDTLINNETWTILETVFAGIQPPPRMYDSLAFVFRAGMILEKDGVVEFMDMNARSRSVLYDYNLEFGDIINPMTGAEMVVARVDSMMIFNEYKKRITLYNAEYDYDDVWVEGIGSIKNYFLSPGEPEFAPDAGSQLICMNINGALALVTDADPDKCLFDFYSNFRFPCQNDGVNSANNIDDLKLDLKVFPNPFGESITVESSTPFQKIEVFDLNGKLITQQNNLHNITAFKLDSRPFPNGLYLLKVTATDGTFGRSLVMKNEE